MPDVDQARASQAGHRWGAGSGRQTRSLSRAGLCPVPSSKPLVRVKASSITDGGATMPKSSRYDHTRTRSAARPPTRSLVICLTSASACLPARLTPAA
eukprot:1415117-Alexandrium_andersonii.AAC.1